jgi:hypothetical protein
MLLAQDDSATENRRVNDSASILLVQAHYVTACPCRVLAEMHNMHRSVHIFLTINFLKILYTVEKFCGMCAKFFLKSAHLHRILEYFFLRSSSESM